MTRRHRALFAQPPTMPDPVSDEASPHDKLENAALAAGLERCLDELAPHTRMAVLLHHQEAMSYADMARACRERAGTLRARVSRALPVLRECLQRHGYLS